MKNQFNPQSNFFIGIDLGKVAKHKACLVLDKQELVKDSNGYVNFENRFSYFSFEQTPESLDSFSEFIKKRIGRNSLENVYVNMEPTSGPFEVVAAFLLVMGAKVFYTNPKIISAQRKAISPDVKSDKVDARVLASIFFAQPKKVNPYILPETRIRSLRSLSTLRQTIVENITAYKLRFLAKVEFVWRELINSLPKEQKFSEIMRKFFVRFTDPAKLMKFGQKKFIEWFNETSHGNITLEPEKIWEHGKQADSLAQKLKKHDALNYDFENISFELKTCLNVMRNLEENLDDVEKKIKEARIEVPECDVVQTIPGIGDVVSVTITSILMPAGRFSSLTKVAGYSGFVPKKKSSGTSDVKGLNITKAGNRKLKRDLVLAASVAMRIDPQLAFVATKMLLNGKHFNKVRVAVGRKLLERAFSLLRRYVNGEKNAEYEFRDYSGKKTEKEKAKAEAEGIWKTYEMKMDKKKNRGNQSNHGSPKTP